MKNSLYNWLSVFKIDKTKSENKNYSKARIIALIVLLYMVPILLTNDYYLHILIIIIYYICYTSTYRFILHTGQFHLGAHAFIGIGAYASVLLVTRAELSFWFAMPIAGCIAAVIAVIVGYPALRLKGIYFAIITWGFGDTLLFIYKQFKEPFGGSAGLFSIPAPDPIYLPIIGIIDFSSKSHYYFLALSLLILTLFILYRLETSRYGLIFGAIREGDKLARSVGIDIMGYKVLAFAICSGLAGMAGSFYAHYTFYISPIDFSVHLTISLAILIVVGGVERFSGAIVGTVFLMLLGEIFSGYAHYQLLLYSGLMIIVLILIPKGLTSIPLLLKSNFVKDKKELSRDQSSSNYIEPTEQKLKGLTTSYHLFQSIMKRRSMTSSNEIDYPLLKLSCVTKHFGGHIALNKINIEIQQGEIVGLIGPNGAGKTTLFNVITHELKLTAGNVIFDDKDISVMKPHQIAKLGLVRTFQLVTLFPAYTVLENVLVGLHLNAHTNIYGSLLNTQRQREDDAEMKRQAMEILDIVGIREYANKKTDVLPHGHERALGLCIGLAANPKLLLVDEPLTGMNHTEVQDMIEILKRIRDHLKITIVVVEHNMRALMSLCDRLIAINYGEIIAEGTPEQVQNNHEVIEAYIGKE
mgnify:CR=1 FL=1